MSNCRKFQANVFNKTKCAHCFRQREEHSAEALESDRGSRKVSKCGYLFVAPDWDFSIPLNRTKRWQRRWFILYDDGELTYSVDDHPATIPQGTIDMNRVLEVAAAEDVTGHQYSLAITSPDRVTFVKGTCKDESRWWCDVLSVFLRTQKQLGRHKRNATFPGIKTTSVLQQISQGRSPAVHRDYTDKPPTSESPPTQDKLNHRSRLRRVLRRERNLLDGKGENNRLILPELDENRRDEKLKDIAASITRSSSALSYLHSYINSEDKPTRETDNIQDGTPPERNQEWTDSIQVRRQAEGQKVNVPQFSGSSDLVRVELPAEDLLYIKKGWLMKESLNKEWHKYWFVLHGSGLRFFRDPKAEDNEILDGCIDLGMAKTIAECEVARNYGFYILTWDNHSNVFSAVTSGIRGNWIQALRNAANLKDIEWPLSLGEKIELEISDKAISELVSVDTISAEKDSIVPRDSSRYGACSSDEEYKTASEAFSCSVFTEDDIFEWGENRISRKCAPSSLVPSSHSLSRTVTSLVKDRSRNMSGSQDINCALPSSSSRNAVRSDTSSMAQEKQRLLSDSGSLNSLQDQENSSPEMEMKLGSGDAVLVDLLETQVDSLKIKLEHTQDEFVELHKENIWLKTKFKEIRMNEDLENFDIQCSKYVEDFHKLKPNKEPLSEDSCSTLTVINDKLKAELLRLTKRLKLCEGDLDYSEREVDSLKKQAKTSQREADDARACSAALELQVKKLLEQLQEKHFSADVISELKEKYQEEREQWKTLLSEENHRYTSLQNSYVQQDKIIRSLTRSLSETEKHLSDLRAEMQLQSSDSVNCPSEVKSQIENAIMTKQMLQQSEDIEKLKEALKSESSEVYRLKDLVNELRSMLDLRNEELLHSQKEKELEITKDRLQRGIEENEMLYTKIRECNRQSEVLDKIHRNSSLISISSSRERFSSKKNIPRMDSLSDLTNIDLNIDLESLDKEQLIDEYSELRMRFERAVSEIRAMKKEIKETHCQQDETELINIKLKQDLKVKSDDSDSQLHLMSSRIEDLTSKLNNSEKQVRQLKQKVLRAEGKDRRRSQSLKGKESFSLSKDMEQKLTYLETLIEQWLQNLNLKELELSVPYKTNRTARRSRSFEDSTKSSRLRRKSLDGTSEAMKAIIRVHKVCSNSSQEKPVTPALLSAGESKSQVLSASPKTRSPSLQRKSTKSPRSTSEKYSNKIVKSDFEFKNLKDKIYIYESVFSTLENQLSQCIAWAGSVETVCSCGPPGLTSLQNALNAAFRLVQLRCFPKKQSNVSRLHPLTFHLQDVLREKIIELFQKRERLKISGTWNKDAQLKALAEKLSYETVLLSQLSQSFQSAFNLSAYEDTIRLQELVETHRKLSFLEKKLTNPDFDMDPLTPLEFYTNLLAEKLVVQGEIIASLNANKEDSQKTSKVVTNSTCQDLQQRLLEREKTLAGLIAQYKEQKLYDIAVLMAKDFIFNCNKEEDESVLVEEAKIREIWALAQDLVTQELVNLETSQSLLRMSQLLNPSLKLDPSVDTHTNIVSLECLLSGAEESLRQEIEESVFILSNKYESILAQYRSGNCEIINSVSAVMEQLMGEFAVVLAQKAVIDGQLSVVQGEQSSTSDSVTPLEEAKDITVPASDVSASEAHLLMFLGAQNENMEDVVIPALSHIEFCYLYNKMTGKCFMEISDLSSNFTNQKSDTEVISEPLKSACSSKVKRRNELAHKLRRVSDITGMIDSCAKCNELQQEINRLKHLEILQSKDHRLDCKQCRELGNKLKTLEGKYETQIINLQNQHKVELKKLKDQYKHEPPTKDNSSELAELKDRLSLLEEAYEARILSLQKQYEDALGSQPELSEGSVRQRYQVDIEQLRGLCEKGLGAMENSHRRMITELEEKHRREIATLHTEKEQALAEETQATLAALDAMRKAHEVELQKEIYKFKEEFMRNLQDGQDIGTIHKQHEAEMQEIKREILSLSEKYSVKCLESASLEETNENISKELAECKTVLCEFESRSKILEAQLSNLILKVQTGKDICLEDGINIAKSQCLLKDEEILRLKQQLKLQSHEGTCKELRHWLNTEDHLKPDGMEILKEKLEGILLDTGSSQEKSFCNSQGDYGVGSQNRRSSSIKTQTSKELRRSPSCPKLPSFSAYLSMPLSSDILFHNMNGSPFTGMVASRKRVFESTS